MVQIYKLNMDEKLVFVDVKNIDGNNIFSLNFLCLRSLLAESVIPWTQPGRAGNGLGPQPAVDCLQQHYTYANDLHLHLCHRSRLPYDRARCHLA